MNQENNPDGSADNTMKRKRGRPRKYPKINNEENVRTPNNRHINMPRYEEANGSWPRQVAPVIDDASAIVGQEVIGVVEAAFDAGYLVSVRAANSGMILRGCVFKTGHYVPVTAENDVAPDVPMIRRNEIPLPAENSTQIPNNSSHSRERNNKQRTSQGDGTHSFKESQIANQVHRVATHSTNHVASKDKQVLPVAAPTTNPVISRGNVVPVILQPAKLSDASPLGSEVTPLSVQASHVTALKEKEVQATDNLSNGLDSTRQVPIVVNEALSESQNRQLTISESMQSEHRLHVQVAPEDLTDGEARALKLSGMPFEHLVSEVVKRIDAPDEADETQTQDARSAVKISTENCNCSMKEEPLVIEPLQALQPDKVNMHSGSTPTSVDGRTEKMSELLQALQETVTETEMPSTED